jgi:putative transposase
LPVVLNEEPGVVDLDKRMKWAQFRFSVIAPLVCRKLTEEQRRVVRREILSQTFLTPDGNEKKIAKRTLTEWLARHRQAGFDGLLDSSIALWYPYA